MTEATVRQPWDQVRSFLERVWNREDVQFIAHCVVLLAMMVVLRPMFTALVPSSDYRAPSILWELLRDDVAGVVTAARSKRPTVPSLLFLVVPTAAFLLAGLKIRWEQWEYGKALRNLIIALLAILAWSGATFPYNMYLNQGHFLDRAALIAFTGLSWRFPLALPFAVRWAWVMLRESYVPIFLDDFDFRALHEVMVVAACFVWASFIRTMKPAHFLLVGLGVWASYYYAAGVAKVFYGPTWSWLVDDHLSNLSFGAYVRGWVGFIPETTFVAINDFMRHLDFPLAVFTLVFELGALFGFFINRRLAQVWTALAFIFQFGIFVMTGICFWKWMLTNLAFFVFLSRGGAPIYNQMSRYKLVTLFAIAMVFFSREKIYFNPQTGVAWYDTRMVENYTLHAVGQSGESYLISPQWLSPMDMHFVQGRLCYATNERSVTSIYGVTGNYNAMMALESLENAEDALALANRGRRCNDPTGRKHFEDFFKTYFGNLNKHGRKHRWVAWLGRPDHLWVQPRGNLYDMQEPVSRVELWREIVVKHEGEVHRFDKRRVKVVEIPD